MDDANWLKNEAASMSVREASRKAFFLSKAFGMYPYGDDLRLNWKLLSYSLCLVLTTVGLAVYNTIQVETGTIDVFIGRVEFISLSASVVVGYVKMLTARSDLRDFFAAYERVHADLVPVGLTTSYANKEIYLSACFSLVSLTMISLVDLGMDSFQDELSAYWLTWTLFSYLGWAMQDSCVRQFTALLHYLKNDFVRLKLFLRETARSPNLNCRDTKIEAAASAHDSLTTVCAKLNSIYSIQLLFIVTNDFVILVISTYYILAIAGTLKKLRLVVLIITEILRAILYIVQMWHICSSCQDTSEQANDFILQLYEVMKSGSKRGYQYNRNLELHILMKKQVEFTAHGFFSLNTRLVQSMIAAATTYLVVLLQFESPHIAVVKNTNKTET